MNDFDYQNDLDEEQSEDKMVVELRKRTEATETKIQKRLRIITRKSFEQLTIDDKQFLKARASYLSKADRDTYAEIIATEFVVLPDGKVVEATEKPVDLSKLNRPALEEMAKDLGIEDAENAELFPNKQTLIDAINKAK